MTKRSHKIDAIDIKIIRELQQNGRKSNIELSDAVGISPSPCLRRLKALQDNNIITGFYADVDEKFFNLNLTMFASISIEVNNEEEREIFENSLSAIPEVREIYALTLDTDYIFKLVVTDWMEYKKVINTKIAKVPFIKKIRTSATTRVIKKNLTPDLSAIYQEYLQD